MDKWQLNIKEVCGQYLELVDPKVREFLSDLPVSLREEQANVIFREDRAYNADIINIVGRALLGTDLKDSQLNSLLESLLLITTHTDNYESICDLTRFVLNSVGCHKAYPIADSRLHDFLETNVLASIAESLSKKKQVYIVEQKHVALPLFYLNIEDVLDYSMKVDDLVKTNSTSPILYATTDTIHLQGSLLLTAINDKLNGLGRCVHQYETKVAQAESQRDKRMSMLNQQMNDIRMYGRGDVVDRIAEATNLQPQIDNANTEYENIIQQAKRIFRKKSAANEKRLKDLRFLYKELLYFMMESANRLYLATDSSGSRQLGIMPQLSEALYCIAISKHGFEIHKTKSGLKFDINGNRIRGLGFVVQSICDTIEDTRKTLRSQKRANPDGIYDLTTTLKHLQTKYSDVFQ